MNRVRPFAELLILAALATGASPHVLPGPGAAPRVQVPERSDLGPLDRETSAEPMPLACSPPEDARQAAGSEGAEEMSGGSAGTLIVGAALLAAVALILAVVIPW